MVRIVVRRQERHYVLYSNIQANTWRNRGELAEGWYDPSTLQKAQQSASAPSESYSSDVRPKSTTTAIPESRRSVTKEEAEEDSDSDDSVGPALPGQEGRSRKNRTGPSIPNMQDLELRRGMVPYEER